MFTQPDAPSINYQEVNQQQTPRCSLDFRIFVEANQVISDSQLRIQSFNGQEHLSQPFEYHIELRANDFTAGAQVADFLQPNRPVTSQSYGALLDPAAELTHTLEFDQVLGASATIMLGLPESENDVAKGTYPSEQPVVYFNGVISNFALGDRGVYHATLKPALFKLGLQNQYRLFNNQTILDVVKTVLDENSIKYNKLALEMNQPAIVCGLANYRKQDWLQAGESDLDFINRLMNKVNLFYYFTHDEVSHTMVITDQPHYKTIYQRKLNSQGFYRETETIKPLYLSFTTQPNMDRDDYIQNYRFQQNMTTRGVTTVLAQKEAVWESQNTSQISPVYQQREYQKEKLNMEHMHTVQYGASWEEVDKLTNTAMNKLQAGLFDFSGSSNCSELKAGFKFQVQETWQDSPVKGMGSPLPIRPSLDKQEFVVISVQHQASAEGDYKNQFSAVSAMGLPTPANPHSISQGSILAQVTQKPASVVSSQFTVSTEDSYDSDDTASEEIDHTGSSAKQLEKTVFTFDSNQFQYQMDQSQEQFSCTGIYVRFIDQPEDAPAQWVKLAEHMQTVPEVGVYVVISRSSDDNEIPEVQQIVQAKGSKVIMPQGYTTNTNVGNSYNTSYGNITGIGFGADITTALETAQNIVNTQRDSGNYNDARYGESSSYSYNVTPHSHNISLTSTGARPGFSPSGMMKYVSYGHSVTGGDTYNESEMTGNSESTNTHTGNSTSTDTTTGDTSRHSTNMGNISSTSVHHGVNNSTSTHSGAANSATNMNGATNSASNTNGAINRADNFNGVNNSVNVTLGMENSAATKTGVFISGNNINGIQLSGSVITGSATSSNVTIGNNTQTNTTTGNTISNNTVIGNSTNFSEVTGLATNTQIVAGVQTDNTVVGVKNATETYASINGAKTVGSQAETNTVASKADVDTVAADTSVRTTQADNSVESTTAQNKVVNISAGTTTTNDSSIITESKVQQTELVAATKVIL